MKKYRDMNEVEFIESIDCTFDFNAGIKADFAEIIDVGSSLSDNAALMVAFVLAIGKGAVDLRTGFLRTLKKKRPTPLIKAAFPVVEALIKDKDPNTEDVEDLFELSRRAPGSYNALCIVDLADDTKGDSFPSIYEEWKTSKPFKTA